MFITNENFSTLKGLRKMRKVAELKCYAVCLEWKGIQELELAMVGTPASWLVDIMSAGVHKAGELAPPSPQAPSPSVEGWKCPFPLGSAPKRAHHPPTPTTSVASKEEEKVTVQEALSLMGLSEAIAGPSGSSHGGDARGHTLPCHIPQLTLPAGSFTSVNLKDSSMLYICEQCEKQTSNWDSMVSHCLWEHLGICLFCPHCGMSYLDPLKFHLHGKWIHNLLFH